MLQEVLTTFCTAKLTNAAGTTAFQTLLFSIIWRLQKDAKGFHVTAKDYVECDAHLFHCPSVRFVYFGLASADGPSVYLPRYVAEIRGEYVEGSKPSLPRGELAVESDPNDAGTPHTAPCDREDNNEATSDEGPLVPRHTVTEPAKREQTD